jgi:hypothetical protein
MLAPDQFYPDERPHIRVKFDTSDLNQARSLRILKEADASGSFGPNGFRCYQLGPHLYTVAFYPGWAKELHSRKPLLSGERETP